MSTSPSERGERNPIKDTTSLFLVYPDQEFSPLALPSKPYHGFPVYDGRNYEDPVFSKVTLSTHGKLPDLGFNVITLLPMLRPKIKTEILVESDIAEAIKLGIVHRSGNRRLDTYPYQPFGFNEDVLPTIEQLRFRLIVPGEEVEAKPDPAALRKRGLIEFKFKRPTHQLTPDLKAVFRFETNTRPQNS